MNSQNTVTLPKMALTGHQKVAFAILTTVFLLCWRQPTLAVLGLAALFVLPPLLYLTFRVMDGDADPVMILWLALFPLSYYFQAVRSISVDLILISMLAAGLALCPKSRITVIPPILRRAGWAWFVFLAAALISLVSVVNGHAHLFLWLWLKGFLLPAVLGWYVVACFAVRSHLRLLHGIICAIAIYALATGLAELYLGRADLWSAAGTTETFAGAESEGFILRVTGPYGSDNSFGLIGLITFYFLWFLRNAMDQPFPRWQRILHVLGMAAAMLTAMMPLFRSIFITIILILLLDLFRQAKGRKKALRMGGLAAICIGILALGVYLPGLFQERVSSLDNIYARVAQTKQNLQLFLDNPVLGVGLGNYYDTATHRPELSISYGGIPALDWPHSNIGAVLAETGLAGFVPYALSQCLLIAAFWKLRSAARSVVKLAWTFFIYIFLSYWISGLALTSGYDPDLNLWFIFALAVIYKYAISSSTASKISGTRALGESRAEPHAPLWRKD
jgi:O-antigen ligase